MWNRAAAARMAAALVSALCASWAGVATAAQASQELTIRGVEIHYSVMSADALRAYPEGTPERAMHGGLPRGSAKRHVMVALLDAKTKQPIEDASVKARVAELAQSGKERKLEKMVMAGAVTYGNYFTMKGRGPYRVTVTIVRPNFADKTQATFDYTAWDK